MGRKVILEIRERSIPANDLVVEENPLVKLHKFGQSIWLDQSHQTMLVPGELERLVHNDELRGLTSNYSAFEEDPAGSRNNNSAIRSLILEGKSVHEIRRSLIVENAQRAAALFYPIYQATAGRDGFVSLGIPPQVAYDTNSTIVQARRLWARLNRPNVMIEIPATPQGLPAIQKLISEGINVNATLLFSPLRYREVAESYIRGMETRVARGESLERVASVASFFLSPIDVLVDPMLEALIQKGVSLADVAQAIHGRVAVASAKVAYQMYDDMFDNERFRELAARAASPQRLLWASTTTKNPLHSDLKYVEPLIGPETVNTMSLETLDAYRDHGVPAPRLEEDGKEAVHILWHLSELGIDLDKLAQQLEGEGVRGFIASFDHLMTTLEAERDVLQ